MSSQNPLVDRDRLAQNRARALRRESEFFLHQEARASIEDRLSMVNKSFSAPALVTGFPNVWRKWFPDWTIVADEDVISLEEGAHDLVVHAMALHWANDPVGQLIQCNRALRPDGLMLAIFPGDQTLHELRTALAEAEVAINGGLSSRVLPMGEIRDLGALLQRASFALPVADKSTLKLGYRDIPHLARDLRDQGEGNSLSGGGSGMSRDMTALAEAIYRSNFIEGDRLIATFDLVCLTGWAPDESQPKPLLPGSARTRLADALGTKEFNLPEKPPAGH